MLLIRKYNNVSQKLSFYLPFFFSLSFTQQPSLRPYQLDTDLKLKIHE